MSDPFDFLPSGWSRNAGEMWDDTFGDFPEVFEDDVAQALYHDAYFNFDLTTGQKNAIREVLDDYMMGEYGIDFDAQFDWEDYRERYGVS